MQYNLSLEEVSVCKTKNSKTNQLAFGIMLAHLKKYSQFPSNRVDSISKQLLLQVAKYLEFEPIM